MKKRYRIGLGMMIMMIMLCLMIAISPPARAQSVMGFQEEANPALVAATLPKPVLLTGKVFASPCSREGDEACISILVHARVNVELIPILGERAKHIGAYDTKEFALRVFPGMYALYVTNLLNGRVEIFGPFSITDDMERMEVYLTTYDSSYDFPEEPLSEGADICLTIFSIQYAENALQRRKDAAAKLPYRVCHGIGEFIDASAALPY